MMEFSVDHAGDSNFWVNRDGRIVYVNDAGCAGRGYTREELLGMMIYDLNPDFSPRGQAAPKRYLLVLQMLGFSTAETLAAAVRVVRSLTVPRLPR